ncbi:EamA family transporter [Bradyrhizobium sp. Arg237L]|uniref:DMT family transporter n=1 Tax=Bradyrhizobium sp. Arg237L TaxID=3003352 RepID=UPI00249ED3E7|nr:EamA family transporter [Bradyrhizobium sp. Arg237L]MDI4234094.1 EamA family transporter [Bradyrhizobium sp. Arg237L]
MSNAYIHLLIVYVVWGTVYPVIRLSLTGPDAPSPLQLQGGRLFLAAVILAALASLSGRLRPVPWHDVGLCVICGLLFWVSGNGFATFALRELPSGCVTMAMATIPLWTALFQFCADRQPIGRPQIAALVLGFAGMGIVYVPAFSGGVESHLDKPIELTAAFLAPVTWAIGSVIQQPSRLKINVTAAASIQLAAGGLACIGLAWLEGTPLPKQLPPGQALAFGYLVVFVGVLCFSSYLRVTRMFPAHIAATFAYVNPIVSVLLASYLLGERPSALSLLGGAIVISSVVILLLQITPADKCISNG